VQANNPIEEGAGDRRGRVVMTERDEVCILGEAIHHCKNDGLASNLRQPFNEIHQYVGPDLGRHIEGLQQPRRTRRRRLVALAGSARAHPILHKEPVPGNVKVGAQSTQCLLNALMASRVRQEKHLVAQVPMVRHEDAGPM